MTTITREMIEKLRQALLNKCDGHETHKTIINFDAAVENDFSNNSQRANILYNFEMTADVLPKFSEVVALRKSGLSSDEITTEKDLITLSRIAEKL